jgi:hypothetical protein
MKTNGATMAQIEFGRFRQVRDVPGVRDQGRLLRHRIHQVDGPGECPADIGVGVLVEPNVCVADLHEQSLARKRCEVVSTIRSRFRAASSLLTFILPSGGQCFQLTAYMMHII